MRLDIAIALFRLLGNAKVKPMSLVRGGNLARSFKDVVVRDLRESMTEESMHFRNAFRGRGAASTPRPTRAAAARGKKKRQVRYIGGTVDRDTVDLCTIDQGKVHRGAIAHRKFGRSKLRQECTSVEFIVSAISWLD